MMKRNILLLLAVALSLGAAPLAAQDLAAGPVRVMSVAEQSAGAVPKDVVPPRDLSIQVDASAAGVAGPDAGRWNAPLIGMVAGAVIGGLIGVEVQKGAQDAIGPPAWYVTIPLGAIAGYLVGLAVRN
jgi:outer membrane lipoprotein SlyB